MVLIGLNGKKGSGKDTAGEYLCAHYDFECLSFAEPLKVSAAAALGFDPPAWDTFEEWKNNPDARIVVVIDGIEEKSITVREFLQFYGTEAHRNVFGADFWTKQLLDRLDPHGRYVITDARFVNECSAIKDAGGTIILIERPGTDAEDAHASEAPLPDELIDTTINNNGTVADFHRTLDAYMAIITVTMTGTVETLAAR